MLRNKKGIELSINMIVVIILGLALLGVGISIFYSAYAQVIDVREQVDSQTQQQLNDLLDTGEAIVIPINSKDVERGDYVDFDLGISNELGYGRLFFVYIRFDSYAGPGNNVPGQSINAIDSWLHVNTQISQTSCRYSTSYTDQNCADKWLLFSRTTQQSDIGKENDKFFLENNRRKVIPLRFVTPRKISTGASTKALPEGQYIFNVDIYSTECGTGNPTDSCSCNPSSSSDVCTQYFSRKKIYVKVN